MVESLFESHFYASATQNFRRTDGLHSLIERLDTLISVLCWMSSRLYWIFVTGKLHAPLDSQVEQVSLYFHIVQRMELHCWIRMILTRSSLLSVTSLAGTPSGLMLSSRRTIPFWDEVYLVVKMLKQFVIAGNHTSSSGLFTEYELWILENG